MLCPLLPSTLIQKTEYQVPNQDLKQIFKLAPDSANRLLLIEMRLILGLGLANLMPRCCAAHFSILHRGSPVVSQAAVEPLQLQISTGEQGRAICGCACSPAQPEPGPPPKHPGPGPCSAPSLGALEPARLFRSSGGSSFLGRLWWSPAPQLGKLSDLHCRPRPRWMEPKHWGKPNPGFPFQTAWPKPGREASRR